MLGEVYEHRNVNTCKETVGGGVHVPLREQNEHAQVGQGSASCQGQWELAFVKKGGEGK